MFKRYYLLKGTVSRLTIFEEPEEMRSDNIGLLAFIGLSLIGLIGTAAALIGSLTTGSIKLAGQGYACYVGSKRVEGKLVKVCFKEGDYVEMVVKAKQYEIYQAYAVRVPNQHALYFPHSMGTPTLELLKYISIAVGCLTFFSSGLLILVVTLFYDADFDSVISSFIASLFVFFLCTMILFFMVGGRYSFVTNKIYGIYGYTKLWLLNTTKEEDKFKKMNRSGDPELFDDPQTPEFTKIPKLNPHAYYYVRTPTLPAWVTVLDEIGKHPEDDVIIMRDNG